MAEAVASIVGITAFSLQIGERLYKVKELYVSIKSAPDEIAALLQDCERLSKILCHNASQLAQVATLVPTSTAYNDCQESCSAALQKLDAIARELEEQIGRSRFTGSVRALLRQDVIMKQKTRFGTVRDDLILALQSLNMFVLSPIRFHSNVFQCHIL